MPLIRIKDLTKLYRMGDSIVHALDGVDLEIDRGEFVAITGASGSGKSTIMHLLGCLDRPTGGEYLLDGRNVSEMSDRELARIRNQDIGFVFQTFNLINRTSALENVGIPLFYSRTTNTRGPARRALERVGLTPRSTHTPAELSGGERQRVAIARAIVNDPLLLLADEPTGNLDTRTGEQIMEIFHSLNEQGVTIVLVTHEHDVAMQTKRIVQMRDGKVVMDMLTKDIRSDRDGPTRPKPTVDVATQEPSVSTQPVATARAVPTAEPAQAASKPVMTPHLITGANGAFGCGLAAPLLLLASVILTVVMNVAFDRNEMSRETPPPPGFAVLGLAVVLCLLLSLVAGFIGIFWGRAVLRRIRTVPGEWIGRGRTRAGVACGLVTVLLPVAMLALMIASRMARAGGG